MCYDIEFGTRVASKNRVPKVFIMELPFHAAARARQGSFPSNGEEKGDRLLMSRQFWERGLRALAALVLAAMFFVPVGAEAMQYHVTQAGAGMKNGDGWGNALGEAEFIGALQASRAGDVFWVAEGSYRPSTTGDVGAFFVLKDGVKLYGGFDGTETQLSQRDWKTHVTVLTGDLGGGSHSKRSVVRAEGCSPSTVLDGFTIAEGQSDSDVSGGGMIISGGAPTLENCTFRNNKAKNGAGLYVRNASPSVATCEFLSNTSYGLPSDTFRGGGLCIEGGNPVVTNCLFQGNTLNGDKSYGGGLCSLGGSPVIVGCTFIGNQVVGINDVPKGGGLYVEDGDPIVANCTFKDNRTEGGHGGGASFAGSGRPIAVNCTFNGNSTQGASDKAGGIDAVPGTQVANCILWGNGDKELSDSVTPRHCVIQNWTGGGTGNTANDPKLAAGLADNGGPTRTLKIEVGSSAKDAGTLEGLSERVKFLIRIDQRGHKRDATPDIGAYEADSSGLPTRHFISVQPGQGGSVRPVPPAQLGSYGGVEVDPSGSVSFTISANTGYVIRDVTVDGTSVGAVSTYTFSNVTEDHALTAAFQHVASPGPNPPAPGPNLPQPPASPDVPPVSPDIPPASSDVTPAPDIPTSPRAWTVTLVETESRDILRSVLTVPFRSPRRIEAVSADVRGFEPGSTRTELVLKAKPAAAALGVTTVNAWSYLLRVTGSVPRAALKDAAVTALRYRFESETKVRTLSFPNGGISISDMAPGKDESPKSGKSGGGCSAGWGGMALLALATLGIRRRQ